MLIELKNEMNKTYTENNAVTYHSSLDACLDFFALVGGMRHSKTCDIIKLFHKAYIENHLLAMKLLFYVRDIRGGIGERQIFRDIMVWMANNYPKSVKSNIRFIPEYGRWDDLLCLLHTKCEAEVIDVISQQLRQDILSMETDNNVSLIAKWLPSVNTSNKDVVQQGRYLAKLLNLTEREYRKLLSRLRKQINILESNLCCKDYSFDYGNQPSKAMFKYRKAFLRNDSIRYNQYLKEVIAGKKNLNVETLMPYEIIRPLYTSSSYKIYKTVLSDENLQAIEATWKSQKDYANDCENTLVVIDGSGSMYTMSNPSPALVAQSLGLYFAERNKGEFANHFITFSEKPQLVEIKGNNLQEKLWHIISYNECANTNIEAVFRLILKAAVKNRLSQENLPKRIVIISDMEFDSCSFNADVTNFQQAKQLFLLAGYELPHIVFWNVAARNQHVPVTNNERGVTLISGFSPNLFDRILNGKEDPYSFMLSILESERYDSITA